MTESKAQQSQWLGDVRLFLNGDVMPGNCVRITASKDFYPVLGATSERWIYWQDRYGYGSLGLGDDGELFVPGFPIFSKVAWMFVDSVILSESETISLVHECERAIELFAHSAVVEIFRQIRDLASEAIKVSATLYFGRSY